MANLPLGAKYENKQGNATATATRDKDGNIEITANCDSLTFLVEELNKEVYHFRSENTALKTQLKEKETVELSGWQNFQIYGFRIGLALWIISTIIRKYKNKIKKLWQKKN